MTWFVIALSTLVWLYTVTAMKNGGGCTTAVAILGTFTIAFGGIGAAVWNGNLLLVWIILGAIVAGFFALIVDRDDGWFAN